MARGDDQTKAVVPRRNPFRQEITSREDLAAQKEKKWQEDQEKLRVLEKIPVRSGYAYNPLDSNYMARGVAIETEFSQYYPSMLGDISGLHGGPQAFAEKAGLETEEINQLYDRLRQEKSLPEGQGYRQLFALGLSLGLLLTTYKNDTNEPIDLDDLLNGKVPDDLQEITAHLATARASEEEGLAVAELAGRLPSFPLDIGAEIPPPGISRDEAQRTLRAIYKNMEEGSSPGNSYEMGLATFAHENRGAIGLEPEAEAQALPVYLAGLWSGAWLHHKKNKDF